jgi:hypothetical protein
MNRLSSKYRVLQALTAALALHAVALVVAAYTGLRFPDEGSQYVEVQWADESIAPVESRSMQEVLAERLNAEVANRTSDQNADPNDPLENQPPDFTEAVEKELRDLEAAAFEELESARDENRDEAAQNIDDTQEQDLPDADEFDWKSNRFEGQVTASYELEGRKARMIDIPGYRCKGSATVELRIEVSPSGEVLSAKLGGGSAPDGAAPSCAEREAIRSALRSRFVAEAGASRRQAGTLTYRFVPQ